MRLHTDLVEAAIELGRTDALGSYPTERAVFDACVARAARPVAVTSRLASGLADVYDEAREAVDAGELEAPDTLSSSHA